MGLNLAGNLANLVDVTVFHECSGGSYANTNTQTHGLATEKDEGAQRRG